MVLGKDSENRSYLSFMLNLIPFITHTSGEVHFNIGQYMYNSFMALQFPDNI